MGGKTVSEEKTNSTQTSAPPIWTAPGISNAASKVTAALDGLPGSKYMGEFVAQPKYGAAIDAYGRAGESAKGLGDWASNYVMKQAPVQAGFSTNLDGLNTSAGLPGAIGAAIHPVQRQLLEQTLPGLRNSALESGAYSNDRAFATLPGMAIRDSNENQQRIAAELGYRDLQDNADRQLQAYGLDTQRGLGVADLGSQQQMALNNALPDLIDTIMRMRTGEGDLAAGSAGLAQQQEQAGIDNAQARNDYSWQYPFQGLDIASSLLAQLSGGYGTTTGSGNATRTQTTSGLGPILQGVLGAAAGIGSLPMSGGGSLLGNLFKKGK